jgi:hypothetical protein
MHMKPQKSFFFLTANLAIKVPFLHTKITQYRLKSLDFFLFVL